MDVGPPENLAPVPVLVRLRDELVERRGQLVSHRCTSASTLLSLVWAWCKRRRDRAALHADGSGDRLVVEVGVVTQKQDEPLPLGQGSDGSAQLRPVGGVTVLRAVLALVLPSLCRRALLVAAEIDERPPEPPFERLDVLDAVPVADRACERLLHGIARPLAVGQGRQGDPQEAAIPVPVELLDRRQRRRLAHHHLYRLTWAANRLGRSTASAARSSYSRRLEPPPAARCNPDQREVRFRVVATSAAVAAAAAVLSASAWANGAKHPEEPAIRSLIK